MEWLQYHVFLFLRFPGTLMTAELLAAHPRRYAAIFGSPAR